MSMPAVAAIRAAYPHAELTAVARPWVQDLVDFCPQYFDRMVVFDDQGHFTGARDVWMMGQKLRQERFDRGYVFTRHLKGRLLLAIAGVPNRFSMPLSHHFLSRITQKKHRSSEHQSHRYLDLIRTTGIEVEGVPNWTLKTPPDLLDIADRWLQDLPRPWVFLHAGSAYGGAKRWPAERYAATVQRVLGRQGGTAVLLGVESEREVNASISQALSGQVVDLCGKTSLRETVALIGLADLVLSNDSGLMHVAAAWGRPQIAIFGPTDEHATHPQNSNAQVLVGQAYCRPCFRRECPIDHRCMNSIQVDDATNALLALNPINKHTNV